MKMGYNDQEEWDEEEEDEEDEDNEDIEDEEGIDEAEEFVADLTADQGFRHLCTSHWTRSLRWHCRTAWD